MADSFVARIALFNNQSKVFDLPAGNQTNDANDYLRTLQPDHQEWIFQPRKINREGINADPPNRRTSRPLIGSELTINCLDENGQSRALEPKSVS